MTTANVVIASQISFAQEKEMRKNAPATPKAILSGLEALMLAFARLAITPMVTIVKLVGVDSTKELLGMSLARNRVHQMQTVSPVPCL